MKKILVIIMLLAAGAVSAQERPTCKGKTKSGNACKSVIVSKKTGYCNAHDPNREKCSAKNSTGKPCGMVPLKNSDKCRFHNKG